MANRPSRNSMSLSQLLAEVDKLEREIKLLNREAQKGEQYVHLMEEMIDRDMKKYAEIERDIANISKESRELEERDKFLTNAIQSGVQSANYLKKMENEAQLKLQREMTITNDLYQKLSKQVSEMRNKVESEEDMIKNIPEFAMIKSRDKDEADMELQISQEKKKIEHLKEEISKYEKCNEGAKWEDFMEMCVKLAEVGLDYYQNADKLDHILKEKEKVDHEIGEIKERLKEPASILATSSKDLSEVPMDITESNLILNIDVPDNDAENHFKPITRNDSLPSSDITIPSAKPTPTKEYNPNAFKLIPPLKSSLLLTKPSPRKEISEERVVQPQTPRTKALHLKLGTSLLALKKSSKQTLDGPLKAPSKLTLDLNEGSSNLVGGSRVEEMEVGNTADVVGNDSNIRAGTFERNEVEKVVEKRKSRSRPSSPIPNIFKSVFNQKTDDSNAKDKDVSLKPVGDRDEKKNAKSRPSSPLPRMLKSVFNHKPDGETKDESGCNLKSFRLGIPSLFPKKKSSKDLLREGPPLSMETTSEELNPKPIDKVPSSTTINNKPPSQNDSSSVLKTCSSIEDVGQTQEENPLNSSEVKDIGSEKLLDKSDDENNDSFFTTQDSNLNFDFFGKEPAEEEANENFFDKGNDGDTEEDFDFFGKGKEDADETVGNDNFFGNGSEGDKEANFDFFGSGSTKEDDGNNDFFSFASGGTKRKDENPFSFF